jgi:uncharacterized protein YjbJ (UPF0337 family)
MKWESRGWLISPYFKTASSKAKKEIDMDSTNENLKGSVNSAVGSLKEAAGKATGNKNLQDEGSIQKTKGDIQKLAGSVKDVIKKGKNLLGVKPDKA